MVQTTSRILNEQAPTHPVTLLRSEVVTWKQWEGNQYILPFETYHWVGTKQNFALEEIPTFNFTGTPIQSWLSITEMDTIDTEGNIQQLLNK
ncbi:MAG: hypothetical protein ACFB0B_03455 [Thermonemataceae bacterium]